MKKLLLIFIAFIPFVAFGQTAASYVASGDSVTTLTDSSYVFVDKVGEGTDSSHVIRLKPLFDAKLGAGDDITLLDGTANRIFYTDGSGNLTALAFGTDNQILKMNGSSLNWEEDAGGGTTTITDMEGTAWRVLYINGDGDVTELTPGADGTVLTSTGATSAPAFESVSGTGDLLSTNNLSDVASAATSRTNLDVYSQDEVADLVHDSLDNLYSGATVAVALADSGVYDGGYVSPTMLDTKLDEFDGMDYDTIDYLVGKIESLESDLADLAAAVEALGSDVTPPAFVSAELGTYNDSIVAITLNATDVHQDSLPPVSAFNFTAGSDIIGIYAVSISDSMLYLALDSTLTVYDDSILYLDYTRSWPRLQDSTGNATVAWVDSTVTNNLAEAPFDGGIVTDGDFPDNTNWTEGTPWEISEGVASFDDSESGSIDQAAGDMQTALELSTTYDYSLDVTLDGAGTANITIRDDVDSELASIEATATDTYTGSFTTVGYGGATKGIRITASSASTVTFSVDNFSVTEQ